VQVFPLRHPAIDFLLLLAVADDAIGLIIIAVQYSEDVQPIYILMSIGAAAICLVFNKLLRLQHWLWYIIGPGVLSWVGLTKAKLHPALALVFVVPFLPSSPPAAHPKQLPTLQAFEHALKPWVDFGLFFFTLANAGVDLSKGGGPLTVAVLLALVAGKLIGVVSLVYIANKTHCAPLNSKVRNGHVVMVASMASIGLTVALFVAGEAFKKTPALEGEAKFGALLSGLMGFVCVGVSRMRCWYASTSTHSVRKSQRTRDPSLVKGKAYSLGAASTGPRGSVSVSRVPHKMLRASAVAREGETSPERSQHADWKMVPAVQALEARQTHYYRHAIRAGDNALEDHPSKLQHPSLFAVDPEASVRARIRWRSATVSVLPLDEKSVTERNSKSVIAFMQKSVSESRNGSCAQYRDSMASVVEIPTPDGSSSATPPAGGEAYAPADKADEVTPFEEEAPGVVAQDL